VSDSRRWPAGGSRRGRVQEAGTIGVPAVEEAVAVLQHVLADDRHGGLPDYFFWYFRKYCSDRLALERFTRLVRHLFDCVDGHGQRILDLGCGFGFFSVLFRLWGASGVVAYDHNTEKIHVLRLILCHYFPDLHGVLPVLGNGHQLTMDAASVDVVLLNDVISHVGDFCHCLREVRGVLGRGGRLLIRDSNNKLFLPGLHKRRRLWRRRECGPVRREQLRGTDTPLPFVAVREQIIREHYPNVSGESLKQLARATAGQDKQAILATVETYREGFVPPSPRKRVSRDPVTGEWLEREFNPFLLRRIIEELGFDVSFVPSYCRQRGAGPAAIAWRLLFRLGRKLPRAAQFVCPSFTLLCVKT